MKCASLLALAVLSASPVIIAQTPDTDMADRLAACASCHGAQGEGRRGAEYYPHLAGKPAGYLFDQVQGFRDGRRHFAQMVWLVQFADDAYLQRVAAYYANQPPRTRPADRAAPPLTPSLQQRAIELVQRGRPADGLPACQSCHGESLAGLEPGIPALLGLPADYLVAQLGAWQNGVREARAPDCMAAIAKQLSPEDVGAVAAYLSQQAHEPTSLPLPAGSLELPVPCGSFQAAQ